ncbi:hypothetical protein BDF19DRAFT_166470 [Syncephalis fuscata]|nr:hypothetical protein BDF19DRAFT_166470 [Syncephalis fuscata]
MFADSDESDNYTFNPSTIRTPVTISSVKSRDDGLLPPVTETALTVKPSVLVSTTTAANTTTSTITSTTATATATATTIATTTTTTTTTTTATTANHITTDITVTPPTTVTVITESPSTSIKSINGHNTRNTPKLTVETTIPVDSTRSRAQTLSPDTANMIIHRKRSGSDAGAITLASNNSGPIGSLRKNDPRKHERGLR